MSIGVAPLTHHCLLQRAVCSHCHLETLHKGYRCLHCGFDHTPPRKPPRKAFGARLVLGAFKLKCDRF